MDIYETLFSSFSLLQNENGTIFRRHPFLKSIKIILLSVNMGRGSVLKRLKVIPFSNCLKKSSGSISQYFHMKHSNVN